MTTSLGKSAICGELSATTIKTSGNIEVNGASELVADTLRTPAGNLTFIMDGGAIYTMSDSTFSASGKEVISATLRLTSLPTSAPATQGSVWNDGGTLKIVP
jgi:hypothetical protein